jgi:hypothetical protein
MRSGALTRSIQWTIAVFQPVAPKSVPRRSAAHSRHQETAA